MRHSFLLYISYDWVFSISLLLGIFFSQSFFTTMSHFANCTNITTTQQCTYRLWMHREHPWVWQLQLQLVSKLSRNFVLNFVRNHFPHTAPPRTNLRSLNCDFAIFIIRISGYNHLEVRVIVLSFEWTIYIYSWGQTNPLERAFHIFFSF